MKKITRDNQTTSGRPPKSYAKAFLMRHYAEPDFSRVPLEIPSEAAERFFTRLCRLYGAAQAQKWMPELERILKVHYAYKPTEMIESEREFERSNRFTERDMILITYGDLLQSDGHSPLETLRQFIPLLYLNKSNGT